MLDVGCDFSMPPLTPLDHDLGWELGFAGLAVGVAFARAVEVAGTASQEIRLCRLEMKWKWILWKSLEH